MSKKSWVYMHKQSAILYVGTKPYKKAGGPIATMVGYYNNDFKILHIRLLTWEELKGYKLLGRL